MATMQNTPAFAVPDRGFDSQEIRPGVPMEAPPKWAGGLGAVARQQSDVPVLKRMEIDDLTPVYGTAQPPRGLSGAIRTLAYKIPEHRPSRWMTLLLADRVDIVEHGLPAPVKWALLAAPIVLLGARALRKRSLWERTFG